MMIYARVHTKERYLQSAYVSIRQHTSAFVSIRQLYLKIARVHTKERDLVLIPPPLHAKRQ
jgi:hypothetical protein